MRPKVPEDLIPAFLAEIDEHWRNRQRPCPEVVYQYTSMAALVGIFTSQRVWATHALETNDTTELSHAITRFKLAIDARARAATLPEYQVLYPPQVQTFDYLHGSRATPFIACFSGKEDDLSQWHRYGDSFNGVAIGFSTAELSRLDRADLPQNVGFTGIEYDNDRQDEYFNRLLMRWEKEAALAIGPGLMNSHDPLWYLARWFAPLATSALALFPRMKQSSFYAEDEWRVGHFHIEGVRPCCHVHSGDFKTRVELDLGQLVGRLPVVSVWLGPGIANDESMHILAEFLQAHGYDIPVQKSRVPIRVERRIVVL